MMAREDMLIDEGVAFGRRRTNTPTTPATAEEVQAAIDTASTDLGVDRAIENEAAANLFAPIGGGVLPENPSIGDMNLFTNEGFNPGRIPIKYQKLFGNDADIIGWKVITNADGSQQLSVARGQGDEDGGLQFQTYGATFKEDANGIPVPYVPTKASTASTTSTTSTTGLKTAAEIAADAAKAQAQGERQSAYDLLYSQFKQYGLESLVEPLKGLVISGASPSEFTIRLRETDSYKKRFAANADRIKNGLKAIDEATYLGLEDQYQNVMRNYGLPAEYYARGDMGTQEGFNKFIANDVSAAELEDRVMTAQSRVLNSNPEVLASLKSFYPDITNGDILAYTLDPTKALTDIKRKVTAAEIGGSAMQAGLGITGTRAGELESAGITKAQAQKGFETIGGGLQRGSQLASIYGESPYTQTTAEKEVFGLSGKMDAKKQRQKIAGLEKATFSGQTGISSGALTRDRAGGY
jgi:hypothetical protein